MLYWVIVWLKEWLRKKENIRLLFIINLVGTIYGYIWYLPQFVQTTKWLWPFVPDSPTASFFFTITLLSFLFGRRWPIIEALGAVALFKYGVWAVVMIVLTDAAGGSLNWTSYMLIISHLGMAAQAVLFSNVFSFNVKHLAIVTVWTIANDALDYSLGIFPLLYQGLHPYLGYICTFTVSLSLLSILLFYFLVVRGKRHNFNYNC
ncbi:DUF1405 domain-containing protein [Anaerobacillus sp. MEB173]|uniref:DUF1405 domain-containing protein n=1 Tax=Anaerobacillus sp. MEB173 TaxID=3383345 RepID=UPI003F8E8247